MTDSTSNTDFSHLKQFEADAAKTVEFEFPEITINGVSPVLIVKTASASNKPFTTASLKTSSMKQVSKRRGQINPKVSADLRDDDRQLYSKYIITGWKNVTNASGDTVPFSPGAALAFLEQLPDNIFDQVREFCSDPSNFVESLDITVGKN